jgi:hypothetical protein
MPNNPVPAAAPGLPADQPLSSLISDPFVRAAFERSERDQGFACAIPAAPDPELDGGAAEQIELETTDV